MRRLGGLTSVEFLIGRAHRRVGATDVTDVFVVDVRGMAVALAKRALQGDARLAGLPVPPNDGLQVDLVLTREADHPVVHLLFEIGKVDGEKPPGEDRRIEPGEEMYSFDLGIGRHRPALGGQDRRVVADQAAAGPSEATPQPGDDLVFTPGSKHLRLGLS